MASPPISAAIAAPKSLSKDHQNDGWQGPLLA